MHTHVLPRMDDGSKSTEMSLQMLQILSSMNVSTVVATPHYYSHRESVERFLERRERSWERLKNCGMEALPEICLGAEVAYGSRFLEETELDPLCISGTRVLLLEMPFSQWTEMELNVISNLCLNRGYQVVLAHLERFVDLQKNPHIMHRILQLPVYVQINAEAFLPFFKRRRWVEMFANGQAHLLGTDCHNLTNRAPNLQKAREILEHSVGEGCLKRIDTCGWMLLEPSGDSKPGGGVKD